MLQQTCDPTRVAVDLLPPRLLPSDVVTRVAQTQPALLCLGAIVPGGAPPAVPLQAAARPLPRLADRRRVLGGTRAVAETVALLRAEGLDHIGTTVQSTRDHIMHVRQLWPLARAAPQGDR